MRCLWLFAASAASLFAQLAAPGASGVSIGHIHLLVADPDAQKKLWVEMLGAETTHAGSLELLKLPGVFVVIGKARTPPAEGSEGSTVDHIGFLVKSLPEIKAKLAARNLPLTMDHTANGQVIARFPDKVLVEFTEDTALKSPVAFHHIHLSTTDPEKLRAWYLETFGATAGTRGSFLAAFIPGGEVDFRKAQQPAAPSKGRSLDHIGFEVKNLEAFCKKLQAAGMSFDMAYREMPQLGGLKIAFLIDPEGTRIELTEGLSAPVAEKITTGPPKLVLEQGAREGPSWDPAGYLYFVDRNRVSRLDAQGKVDVFRDDAPGANGSLVDPEGRVLVCEASSRRVTRTEKGGSLIVLADNYEGKKLNSPNDLALDSKGRIYFTDPRYGRMDNLEIKDEAGQFVEGVYRIDVPGKVARILTHEVERPNGILVSPDDRYLYVADNYNNREGGARKLYRFDLKPDGTVAPGSRKLIFDWKTGRGPDGFKMDQAGRFYVAAGRNRPSRFETADEFKGGVYILSPSGDLLEFVPFEKDEATNCAFGGPDLKTLYVTAGGQLWSVPVNTPGRISSKR